ncbi:MAG TPA: hypothetical protein VGJ05_12905 [Fimbriiglobus sp.]|jgi:hypothetical protein
MSENISRGKFERLTVGHPMVRGTGDSFGVDTTGWSRGKFERVTVGHPMVREARIEAETTWTLTVTIEGTADASSVGTAVVELIRAAGLTVTGPPTVKPGIVSLTLRADRAAVERLTAEVRSVPQVQDARVEIGIAA